MPFQLTATPATQVAAALSVCLAVLVTREIADEMVAAECERSAIRGMGSLPVSACLWWLQSASDKPAGMRLCCAENNNILALKKKCFKAAVGSKMYCMCCLCPQIRAWKLIILL